MSGDITKARHEIYKTLSLCNFCTSKIAISFIAELPTTLIERMKVKCWYIFSISALAGLVAGEFAFVASLLIGSSSVAAFVASLHIVGYGSMSLTKCLMLWFKTPVFRKVVNDLVDLWPVSMNDQNAIVLKRRSLSALRFGQMCYMFWNIMGVSFYNITPIVLFLYRRFSSDLPASLGYPWSATYPFDKTKPVLHELVYVFECFAGVVSVWSQLGSDLLFTTMASHISMLLRLLQVRIRRMGFEPVARKANVDSPEEEDGENMDVFEEIVSVIKVHQRLINYSKQLEDVFATVNLINVMLSSVNICCVVFNIALLEPWMDVSNKLFLGAALTQVGIICWYADEIFRASVGVADAVYESGWYNTDPRCRRGLLLLLQRSQKPLYFTALKFRNITMITYTSILTTSYSYFTLLYTMYMFIYSRAEGKKKCNFRCAPIIDPVCGVVFTRGGNSYTKIIKNICYLMRLDCDLAIDGLGVKQMPLALCGLPESGLFNKQTKESSGSGRRDGEVKKPKSTTVGVPDHGIVGAYQSCNHSCPTYCIDTYDPVCAAIYHPDNARMTYKPMINHCHVDLYSCSTGLSVAIQPPNQCYKNSAVLMFMSQVKGLKSLGLLNEEDDNPAK